MKLTIKWMRQAKIQKHNSFQIFIFSLPGNGRNYLYLKPE